MNNLLRNTFLMITFLSSVITVAYFINDIRNFIMWWPSGWILLIVVYIFGATPNFRNRYLRHKFGHNSGYKLVKFDGNKVFLLKDKKLIWVKNRETLFELGYDFDDVKKENSSKKKYYQEKLPISIYLFK